MATTEKLLMASPFDTSMGSNHPVGDIGASIPKPAHAKHKLHTIGAADNATLALGNLNHQEDLMKQATSQVKPTHAAAGEVSSGIDSTLGLVGTVFRNPNLIADLHQGGAQAFSSIASTSLTAAGQTVQAAPKVISAAPRVIDTLKKLPEMIQISDVQSSVAPASSSAAVATSSAVAEASETLSEISSLGKYAKAAPFVGLALSTAAVTFETAAAEKSGDGYRQAKAVGGFLGGLAATGPAILAGAAVGSAIPIPIVGTVVGAGVGFAIGVGGTLLGSYARSSIEGPRLQAEYDIRTKAAHEAEIAQVTKIENKFTVLNSYDAAKANYQHVLASGDKQAVIAETENFQQVATKLTSFEGLTPEDKNNLVAIKDRLAKDITNEKSLSVPNSDRAAKTRQKEALASLAHASQSIDVLVQYDTALKEQTIPAVKEYLAKIPQIKQELMAEVKSDAATLARVSPIKNKNANHAPEDAVIREVDSKTPSTRLFTEPSLIVRESNQTPELSSSMKTAMNQAQSEDAAAGLSGAKETTLAQHDPIREKAAMDKAFLPGNDSTPQRS